MNKTKLPVLFISHGSPTIALETENPAIKCWRNLARSIPTPDTILIMSAHWETIEPTITAKSQLETIHDFYGFPESMYSIQYPAKGDALFSENLAADMKLKIDRQRGLDHGTWVPLRSMYPNADIPVTQLSICPNQSFKWHLELGKSFSKLSNQGVLIIGSGGISHNIRTLRWQNPRAIDPWAKDFLENVHLKLMAKEFSSLCEAEKIPHGKKAIPTPDHYLPFMFTIGAGMNRDIKRLFNDINYGTLGMQCYAFGDQDSIKVFE